MVVSNYQVKININEIRPSIASSYMAGFEHVKQGSWVIFAGIKEVWIAWKEVHEH